MHPDRKVLPVGDASLLEAETENGWMTESFPADELTLYFSRPVQVLLRTAGRKFVCSAPELRAAAHADDRQSAYLKMVAMVRKTIHDLICTPSINLHRYRMSRKGRLLSVIDIIESEITEAQLTTFVYGKFVLSDDGKVRLQAVGETYSSEVFELTEEQQVSARQYVSNEDHYCFGLFSTDICGLAKGTAISVEVHVARSIAERLDQLNRS